MGGVEGGQSGFWSTRHHHDPDHYLCPAGPPRPDQLPADHTSSSCWSTKSRLWGRKHRLWKKLRATWLFEWAASCGIFRGGESGWVSDLMYHIHLPNVKTWLFGLFHTSWPFMWPEWGRLDQPHATVLTRWSFNPSNPLLPLFGGTSLYPLLLTCSADYIFFFWHQYFFLSLFCNFVTAPVIL